MRSAFQTRFQWAWLAGWIAALALAPGCARSPETMTLKTAEGTETVAAPRPATLFSMAKILETSGRHAESERLLNQILQKNPDYLPAYNELADLLVRQRRLDHASAVLKAGLEKAPQDPVLLNNAGMCHLLLKQYPSALEHFKKACTAAPADTRYRANLALAYALNGDYKNAQALYQTFLSSQETQQNFDVIRKIRLSDTKGMAGVTPGNQVPSKAQAHPVMPPIKP